MAYNNWNPGILATPDLGYDPWRETNHFHLLFQIVSFICVSWLFILICDTDVLISPACFRGECDPH